MNYPKADYLKKPSMTILRITILLFVFLLSGIAGVSKANEPKLKIVATIKPLHSLVQAVLGKTSKAILLIDNNGSPHNFQLKPSKMHVLANADSIFYMADEMETFMPRVADYLDESGSHEHQIQAMRDVPNLHLLQLRQGGLWSHHKHGGDYNREHGEHGTGTGNSGNYGHNNHGGGHADPDHGTDHGTGIGNHEQNPENSEDRHAQEHGTGIGNYGHDNHDGGHADPDHGTGIENSEDGHAQEHGEQEGGDRHSHSSHGHSNRDPHESLDDKSFNSLDMHFWLDADNAILMLRYIADVLARLDAANKQTFIDNAEREILRIQKIDEKLAHALSDVKNRPYLVFHDAFQYFEKRYGLSGRGSITFNPGSSLSVKRIAELKDYVAARDIRCMFVEPQFSPKAAQLIVEKTSAKIVSIDPLGSELARGSNLYSKMLQHIGSRLQTCLTH